MVKRSWLGEEPKKGRFWWRTLLVPRPWGRHKLKVFFTKGKHVKREEWGEIQKGKQGKDIKGKKGKRPAVRPGGKGKHSSWRGQGESLYKKDPRGG